MIRWETCWTLLAIAALSLGCGGTKSVEFGAVLPLSGDPETITYGESIKRGVELAFDEAKQDPNLGYQISLRVADSAADPATSARQLESLYQEGVLAAVGGVFSTEALEAVKVADRYERVLISPSASIPELTGASRNFFRVWPSDFVEGTKMGNFAALTLKLKTMVILAAESPYGRGIQGVFEGEFERHGSKLLEVIEYPPNTSEFEGLIERVLTLNPDGVYLAAFWSEITDMLSELRRQGYEGKILTTAAFATPQAIEAAGEDAEGVYFTQTVFDVSSQDEPIKSFVSSYRERYGSDPDLYAAHGYDATRILIEALRNAKGVFPSDFWKGMRSIRSFPGVTGSIQFDEKGDVQKYPRVYLIRDGYPVYYEAYVKQVREAFQKRLRDIEERRKRLGN